METGYYSQGYPLQENSQGNSRGNSLDNSLGNAHDNSQEEAVGTVWYGTCPPARQKGRTAFAAARNATVPAGMLDRRLLAENTVLAGKYRIGSVLGMGGMATVYSARDMVLDRWVAVKVCALNQFGRVSADEARLQAGCQHPNLMPLHDAGNDTLAGVAYIVMPLYPGADLAKMLNRYGPMPFRMALLCVDQICSALDFLQQKRQTLHGDIKPANIWLTNSGAALLMDFNLTGLLARGQTLRGGTPGFTAPEALAGRADSRSDVFSLGCVLYECLAGQPAFADDQAVMQGVCVPIARLRPEIFPELAAVVHRALAADPAERYQTAREFQSDLRRPLRSKEAQTFPSFLRYLAGGTARGLNRALRGIYFAFWRSLRRFVRHALRRPLQALIEAGVLFLVGRWLAFLAWRWITVHATPLLLALAAVCLLIVGGSFLRWRGRKRKG